MMGRLLVIHTGGVGDFICTFPALSVLAQTHTIEIAGLPERVALARAAGLAKKVHDLERTGFASVFSGPDERLRAFAQPLTLDFSAEPAEKRGTLPPGIVIRSPADDGERAFS